jgi:alpha-amylase
VYHARVAAGGEAENGADHLRNKQEGLDQLLVYDRHPRKALVDHFYPVELTIDDLAACHDLERGDFATGTYFAKLHRESDRVILTMDRPGSADGHLIHVSKTIELAAGSPVLEVVYVLDDLPPGVPLHFAVELNLAAMAGHAHDRYYSDASGAKLGMLDRRRDLPTAEAVKLTDEWLDLSVNLAWSQPAGLWCFPIETVSQSEGGFEGVYQSSAVIPHWVITADESRRWEVRLRWSLDPASASLPSTEAPLVRAGKR